MTPAARFGIVSILALLLAAALSRLPIIHFGAVQPNLILCVLIASSLFTNNSAFFALLVAIAATLIRQQPILFDPLSLGVACSAIIAFFIKQRVVWPDRLGVIILGAFGTFIVYIITAPRFIVSHPGSFFLEMAGNVIISVGLFEALTFVTGRRNV